MTTRSRDEWLKVFDGISVGPVPSKGKPAIYDSGKIIMGHLFDKGAWRDGDRIFDVGCGNGRAAIPLVGRIKKYLGLDILLGSIEYCRKAFAPWPEFEFIHLDVKNAQYNPGGQFRADAIQLPVERWSFDSALALSLFTHLETLKAVCVYLAQIHTALRDRGILWATFFRSPPNDLSSGAHRTVFKESEILGAITGRPYPWRVLHTEGGATTSYHDQWQMLLEKA